MNADLIIYPPGTQYSSLLPSYIICKDAIFASNAEKKMMFCNLDKDNDIKTLSMTNLVDIALDYLGDSSNENSSVTHFFYDPTSFNYDGQFPVGKKIKFLKKYLRSNQDQRKHSYSSSLDSILGSYFSKNEKISCTIFYLMGYGADLRNDIKNHALDALGDKYQIEVIGIDTSGFSNNHIKFNQLISQKLNYWLSNLDTDFVAFIGFDGHYNLQDIDLSITTLIRNCSSFVSGSRFFTKNQINKARLASYGQSPVTIVFSSLGSQIIQFVLRFKYKVFIEDPLTTFAVFSRVELTRIGKINFENKSMLGVMVSILLSGGKHMVVPVSYLPLRGNKGGGKLIASIKTLLEITFRKND